MRAAKTQNVYLPRGGISVGLQAYFFKPQSSIFFAINKMPLMISFNLQNRVPSRRGDQSVFMVLMFPFRANIEMGQDPLILNKLSRRNFSMFSHWTSYFLKCFRRLYIYKTDVNNWIPILLKRDEHIWLNITWEERKQKQPTRTAMKILFLYELWTECCTASLMLITILNRILINRAFLCYSKC
jgi:hypothetical protein